MFSFLRKKRIQDPAEELKSIEFKLNHGYISMSERERLETRKAELEKILKKPSAN